jgi:hypothetical protein
MVYGSPPSPNRGRDLLLEGLVDNVKEVVALPAPEHHRATWRGIDLAWTGGAFKAELPDGVAVRAIPDGVNWTGQIAIRGGVTSAPGATVTEALDAAVAAWRSTLDGLLSMGNADPKAEGPC